MDRFSDSEAPKWTDLVTLNEIGHAIFLEKTAYFGPHQSPPNPTGGVWVAGGWRRHPNTAPKNKRKRYT